MQLRRHDRHRTQARDRAAHRFADRWCENKTFRSRRWCGDSLRKSRPRGRAARSASRAGDGASKLSGGGDLSSTNQGAPSGFTPSPCSSPPTSTRKLAKPAPRQIASHLIDAEALSNRREIETMPPGCSRRRSLTIKHGRDHSKPPRAPRQSPRHQELYFVDRRGSEAPHKVDAACPTVGS